MNSERLTRSSHRTAQRRVRARLPVAVLALALLTAACGSSGPAATTDALVLPPAVPLQGCTYVLNGSVPVGEPSGVHPNFPAFSPDQAAQSAIQDIATHGGTGIVGGFDLPTGTALYAGPDSSGSPVATLSGGDTLLTVGPVLWTTSSGAEWLAFFVACGGNNPYWVSVNQVVKANPVDGQPLADSIVSIKAAPSYLETGRGSTLPIKIEKKRFAWNVTPTQNHPLTPPARGQYLFD
jgi:hypothetical protein